MKEIEALTLPDNVRYTKDHEWTAAEGDRYKVGVSDFAQDQLGDIVYVELPEVGAVFEQGDEFGTVESVKAVSELYMPMSGEVMSVNTVLEESPELMNNDPYGGGWLISIKAADPAQFDKLLDRSAYLERLKE
jgi:glycine cleavage system H protein